jgi:hypothetical protein
MYNDESYQLTHDEKTMLASLSRELAPSDMLEERVVRALRSEGYLGSARPQAKRGISLMWKIAAAMTLFAGGVATGRYILTMNETPRASATAPASLKDGVPAEIRSAPRPVPAHETIVAEREMWL